MPFSHTPKKAGDIIFSKDWNEAMDEIKRLETDKLDRKGGNVSGKLTIGSLAAGATESALTITHNGSYNWGNALTIDQNEVGNGDGPKIRFRKKLVSNLIKNWSIGIGSAANVDLFCIQEDTLDGYGTSRFMITSGLNKPGGAVIIPGLLMVEKMDAGQISVNTITSAVSTFANDFRQKINFTGDTYGIGTQPRAMYFRSPSGFAWFKGGTHNEALFNAGGGELLMSIDQDGKINGKVLASWGRDYAEFFESENGSALPVGVSVVIGKNGKVRPAEKGELPIGIISNLPSVLGNSPMEWPGKYIKDDYGNTIMETVESEVPKSEEAAVEWQGIIEKGGEITKKDRTRLLHTIKESRPVINPAFDPEQSYIPRELRPEWQKVGLLGQLHLTKGQPVAPSWVKMKDISDTVELWLIK